MLTQSLVVIENVSKNHVDPLDSEKAWQYITYHPLHESERYKIDMIHELTDAKFGVAEVPLSLQEIGEIFRTICNVVNKIDIYTGVYFYLCCTICTIVILNRNK